MGSNELLLIVLFVVPIIALFFLRANAALVFLSVCTGYALGQLLGSELQDFANLFMPGIGDTTLKLGLIAIPAILTVLFFTRSVSGTRQLVNIVPTVGVGFLVVSVVVPLLAPNTSQAITASSLWQQFVRWQTLVIGGGAVASFLFLWLLRPSSSRPAPDKKS